MLTLVQSPLSRRSVLGLLAGGLCLPKVAGASSSALKVASLDYGMASTLLSLGIVPVAVASLADWDRWVIEPEMPGEVVDLGSSWEINFEVLESLRPDLILTTPFNAALTPRLEQVAPVLSYGVFTPEGGDVLPKAVSATRAIAARVGRSAEGEAVIVRMEEFLDSCRRRLEKRAPPPLALVNFMDARHVRIYSAPGLYQNVLQKIGVENAWPHPGNFWGFEAIGIERLADITDPRAKLIAFEPVPADVLPKLSESPLWQQLPFSRPGQTAILPGALMFGLLNEAMRFARLITDHLEAST
ncbi:iron-siderophore ABC transporter substrate-binding protein [Rhizobium sp. SAFR-030]|uniref:iron-siderophore ABC transporter substrate-binding protein n=1 Tax=Rhizobium sp. SAFR-030 TaxID=3387277 RepID=UPI003F8015D9